MKSKGEKGYYADLILPLAVPQYYTYRVPEALRENVYPGCRVNAAIGKRRIYTALVRRLHQTPPEGFEVSEILDVVDKTPLVGEKHFRFWEWIADYYMCTVGEVYRAAVPSGLKPESETRIYLQEDASEFPDAEAGTIADNILQILEAENGLTVREISARTGRKNILRDLNLLAGQQLITMEEGVRERYKPKTEDYVILGEGYADEKKLSENLELLDKRAPKQAKLMMTFLDHRSRGRSGAEELMATAELKRKAGVSHAVLTGLVKKGLLEIITLETSRLRETEKGARPPNPLNPSQSRALTAIREAHLGKEVVLLHGVTSSGKTEVYIHLIAEQISQGKQVLYLLPEIALTAQIIERLRNVFGDKVGVYHSKFSDAERVEVFRNLTGKRTDDSPSYQVILGVRSSVFLPFSNLGLIIVDEEHETTYKQFDPAPRYNARDAAVVLAGMHSARVLMGTATPSFESYLNTHTGRYALVEMKERFKDIELPEVKVINTREARRKKQMKTHFSPVLIDEIEKALGNHEQVILFQNRRGYSPYIECTACGWIPYCKNCDVSLTYHMKSNSLHCHYCGFTLRHPSNCTSCGSSDIHTRGFGTEKVENEIASVFPDAKLARLDLDTTRTRRAYEKIIRDFEHRKVDILIGTQMVSKGLDFDHVRIVGILNADNMLNFPDFRSYERSFQLMAQVSGRAGRKNERGKVIIQTGDPENAVIRCVVQNDYQGFFNQQIGERKQFKYPPFCRIVKLTLRHKQLPQVSQAAGKLAGLLRRELGDRVVGPEFPLINRLYNLHQKCIIVKIERDRHFSARRAFMMECIEQIRRDEVLKNVQIVPDVDPYN